MSKAHYSVNNWLLDYTSGTIVHCHSGKIRRLGEYQFKLLDCLIQHAGETLSRNELTALVWERRIIGDNSLSNAIHALRSALEDDGKQQRVIKTVPRKGYMLDMDFCQPIEVAAPLPPPLTNAAEWPLAESLSSAEMNPPAPAVSPVLPKNSLEMNKLHLFLTPPACWVFAVLLMACMLLVISGIFYSHAVSDDMISQEQGRNQYSNIRIFRIAAAADEMGDEDILKFKSSLKMLNQELIARDAWMTVYYRTGEQVLNYTFAIESTCSRQQLAMTLYHWRTDSQKLANLISDETERKLNEMALCKKS